MTKFLRLALYCAGLGIIVASSSCSSEYDPTPGVPGRDTIRNAFLGDFTAVVDGVQFVANTKYYSDNTTDNIRTLSISGVMDSKIKDPDSNQTISLAIFDYQGPNTYPLTQAGVTASYILKKEGKSTVYSASSLSEDSYITITADGDNIEGSFRFLTTFGTDTLSGGNIMITNGQFSIPR